MTGLMSDRRITELAFNAATPMIHPFEYGEKRSGKISYGLSSFGYDARLSPRFKLFTDHHAGVVDPKALDERCFAAVQGASIIIPPRSYVLGATIEYFRIPKNVLALCVGKSTYARCGIIVNTTPLEPGWEGQITLEISNATPCPVKLYAYEGICQILFFESKEAPETSYADKGGKYQHQRGITLPKVDA